MLTKNIKFKNFKIKKNSKKIKKDLKNILLNRNAVLDSLSTNYKSSYNKKTILKFKKFSNIRIIGMGGSKNNWNGWLDSRNRIYFLFLKE